MEYSVKIVTMETFFGKRSLLINIKIKAVMNKNNFLRDISIYFLKSNFYFLKYSVSYIQDGQDVPLYGEGRQRRHEGRSLREWPGNAASGTRWLPVPI